MNLKISLRKILTNVTNTILSLRMRTITKTIIAIVLMAAAQTVARPIEIGGKALEVDIDTDNLLDVTQDEITDLITGDGDNNIDIEKHPESAYSQCPKWTQIFSLRHRLQRMALNKAESNIPFNPFGTFLGKIVDTICDKQVKREEEFKKALETEKQRKKDGIIDDEYDLEEWVEEKVQKGTNDLRRLLGMPKVDLEGNEYYDDDSDTIDENQNLYHSNDTEEHSLLQLGKLLDDNIHVITNENGTVTTRNGGIWNRAQAVASAMVQQIHALLSIHGQCVGLLFILFFAFLAWLTYFCGNKCGCFPCPCLSKHRLEIEGHHSTRLRLGGEDGKEDFEMKKIKKNNNEKQQEGKNSHFEA